MKPSAFLKKINFKPLDLLFLLVFAAVVVFSFVSLKTKSGSSPMLVITTPSAEYVYSLTKDGAYSVQGKLGVSIIVVKDCAAFFQQSPCATKTCVQCAPVSKNGQWAACLPNGVFIKVEESSSSSTDAVAY